MESNKYLDDISEIKNMMSRSSRFISLSGLSGVLAGMYALVGAALAYFRLETAASIDYGRLVPHLYTGMGCRYRKRPIDHSLYGNRFGKRDRCFVDLPEIAKKR